MEHPGRGSEKPAVPEKLRNAFSGIRFAWAEERNFRLHVVLGFAALFVFALVRPAALWWALIVLCIALVLAAELVNSAIEAMTDHLHPGLHPIIGKAKDMLAGMV
ncbi:MAG: diacylglycerol kinase, partial [Proteobacteria bacterium]|nr:diacylglycerol kinase [Pseudomonadota bacterium]